MRSHDLNVVTIIGVVVGTPTMWFTIFGIPHTALTISSRNGDSGTVSSNRRSDERDDEVATTWVRLVAWGSPLAEACNQLSPGSTVLVTGHLQRAENRNVCDSVDDDLPRFDMELRVRTCLILDLPHPDGIVVVPTHSYPIYPHPIYSPPRIPAPVPISRPAPVQHQAPVRPRAQLFVAPRFPAPPTPPAFSPAPALPADE